jgi:hypothetical protein
MEDTRIGILLEQGGTVSQYKRCREVQGHHGCRRQKQVKEPEDKVKIVEIMAEPRQDPTQAVKWKYSGSI